MHPIVRLFLICNIDGILSIIAFFGAYWLRLEIFPATPIVSTIIVFSCTIFSFILFGVYKRIWRYSSTDDLLIITKATLISVILAAFAFFLTTRLENMPRSTMLIYFILLTILSGGSRITYRLIRDKTLAPINNINERINVLLIGASDEAEALIRSSHKPDGPYHIIGIFDNDKSKLGRKIRGVDVIGSIEKVYETNSFIKEKKITKIIIADKNITRKDIGLLLKYVDKIGISLARLPKISELNKAIDSKSNEARPINIEDLLGRSETRFDKNNLEEFINNKIILITGAGGTIGSELANQISDMGPKKIVLSDYSEFALWNITDKISAKIDNENISSVLLDVRDKHEIDKTFKKYKPDIILHAAALKHVPICEDHPSDAMRTNVIGTKNISEKAIKYRTKTMVLISTDKAVDPTNFMGASKRAAEIYIQNLDREKSYTDFVTVRFGNVLGSTGSVIPLFQNQISRGGPLKVTHKEATRFFMSVKEAVELVLISLNSSINKKEKGDINVLEMGEPMKIDNLAKQLARLSGLTPGKDIKINYTGLRVGEKLHEKLFHKEEIKITTSHPDILIAKSRQLNFSNVNKTLLTLEDFLVKNNEKEAIKILKNLVPEFSIDPKNSVY
ncbi:MAG: SDR family NAD(P)-dependent oxidoreductase [Alphaproteobacteria bacterium]|nr:MAG: polysaccharide biosynthesis protein [Alphaproteobacteria bacterium]